MVVILVLVTVLIVIAIELLREKKKPARSATRAQVLVTHPSTDTAKRYFHPGHCWVRVDHPERVLVGVDDFTQRVTGLIDTIELPREGTNLYQGQPFITLRHGNRAIRQVAPLSGIVERINRNLDKHPSLINQSPYQRGWIAQIIPTNFAIEVNNLLKGAVADRWVEAVHSQLVNWLVALRGDAMPRLGTVLHDGGLLIENISETLNGEEWNRQIDEFYTCVHRRNHIASNL